MAGELNEDSGVSGGSNPTSDPNASQKTQLDNNAGTESTDSPNNTGSGNAQSNPNTASTDAPGRRLKNPLGVLSSYTYQLSLYMITPDAYDAFQASGRTQIDALADATGQKGSGGAYVIAQSGGVNNNESQRAPGFKDDYYIDNFKLKQAINGAATQSSTNTYSVEFDVTEPYGFSFNTKLKEASDQLQEYYDDTGYSGNGTIENPSRQFFIMGIRFLGYDEDGNIVSGDTEFEDLGGKLDESADGNAIFQVYYDLAITAVKFTIEGGATTYKFTGTALAPGKAFGIKRGRINSNKTIIGATFDGAMQGEKGLLTQINQIELEKKEKGEAEFANSFAIAYVGDGVEDIRDARLILPSDTDKSKWCGPDGSAYVNTSDANDASSATAVPDDAQRKIQFKDDTTYIEIFDEVLKGSSYMYDAFTAIYASEVTPDLQSGEQPSLKPNSSKKVAWYKVTPEITKAKWDGILKDWAYLTTFIIERYETPIITTTATNPGTDYYGPHKRYEYWWTGENREILEYTQKLDNLFYNEVIGNANLNKDGVGTGGTADTPVTTNQKTPMPVLNAVGGGRATQNQYVTSLYSPDSYAQAKIKLMGDPDFLVQEGRGSTDAVYQRYYGDDGFRVTANGGQVFIEIDFKESIDYNDETGVMDLNSSILFFKYPPALAKTIKGVSYKVVTVNSNFEGGKFTQELSCVINTFGDANATTETDARTDEDGSATDTSQNNTGTGIGAKSNAQGTEDEKPVENNQGTTDT